MSVHGRRRLPLHAQWQRCYRPVQVGLYLPFVIHRRQCFPLYSDNFRISRAEWRPQERSVVLINQYVFLTYRYRKTLNNLFVCLTLKGNYIVKKQEKSSHVQIPSVPYANLPEVDVETGCWHTASMSLWVASGNLLISSFFLYLPENQ